MLLSRRCKHTLGLRRQILFTTTRPPSLARIPNAAPYDWTSADCLYAARAQILLCSEQIIFNDECCD
jgi:hypothetical protein